ncbi:MAG: hypothetical protein LBQ23_03250 [Puniceicoccales bacterium]|nr:hypothetical protein [Puniceicoccales bacterium]
MNTTTTQYVPNGSSTYVGNPPPSSSLYDGEEIDDDNACDFSAECHSPIQIDIHQAETTATELVARVPEERCNSVETQPNTEVRLETEEAILQPHTESQSNAGKLVCPEDDVNSPNVANTFFSESVSRLTSELVRSANLNISTLNVYSNSLREQMQQYARKIENCQKIIEDYHDILLRTREIIGNV